MRLSIEHTTEYRYDAPVSYALQRVRLTPRKHDGQRVESWDIAIDGAAKELQFRDHFGNETWLLSASGEPHTIAITAKGVVETSDMAGVVRDDAGNPAPSWLFLRRTPFTEPDKAIRSLAGSMAGVGDLARLHTLMGAVHGAMTFDTDATHPATTAVEAWETKRGVCQDYAHIFCAAAREAGIPARYVSGYLMMNDRIEQVATHAWAEARVDGLGWVGFDAANGISPDERYVRIATGLDYRDAAPVSGIRHGLANESLAVHIRVEQ